MIQKLSLLLIFTLLISCNSGSKTTEPNKTASAQVNAEQLPAITEDFFMDLYKKVDAIDYVFYELPFSMSQTDFSAVQANVAFLSRNSPGQIPPACSKAIGRKFFKNNGEIMAEAEMYFNASCQFYVFMEGNKKTYASNMTQEGINFYNNIMQQVKAGQQK